ncbi:MAG: hypothetical protein ACI89X_002162 [Planctomycetota bacterium]|jgi:hypothetical protein
MRMTSSRGRSLENVFSMLVTKSGDLWFGGQQGALCSPAANSHKTGAAAMHQLGIKHAGLSHRYAGRYLRMTDVHGNAQRDLLV